MRVFVSVFCASLDISLGNRERKAISDQAAKKKDNAEAQSALRLAERRGTQDPGRKSNLGHPAFHYIHGN